MAAGMSLTQGQIDEVLRRYGVNSTQGGANPALQGPVVSGAGQPANVGGDIQAAPTNFSQMSVNAPPPAAPAGGGFDMGGGGIGQLGAMMSGAGASAAPGSNTSKVAGGLGGAMQGAQMGSAFGGPGMAAGAVIGGVAGVLGAGDEDKDAEEMAKMQLMQMRSDFYTGSNQKARRGVKGLAKTLMTPLIGVT